MTVLAVPAAAGGSLRQRLIDDMTLRRFSRATQRNYIRDVGRLAAFLRRSPDTATGDDLRRFQIAQQEVGLGVPTMNAIVSALRFFFVQTLNRPDLARGLVRLNQPRTLPDVLSAGEVGRLLDATVCLKHLAALSLAYGAGLRVAEVAALRIGDIDSTRMILRIERGKGGRDRNAMLSADLLDLLRRWWSEGHRQGVLQHQGWLFPGQDWARPISTRHSFTASSSRRHARPGSPSASVPIPCATPSPPISWRTASTSASSRSCSDTPRSTTPRCIPGSRRVPCAR